MHPENGQPLRPTQFAENHIIRAILNHTYPPNSKLPAERELAGQIGVTRPTLRETLQRLASEGWVRIRHGKPTIVNDYWLEGGLGMLGTMARYADSLPENFINDLLEVRLTILPGCARSAAGIAPRELLAHLKDAPDVTETPGTFAAYDWDLQVLMVRNSGNRIYPLILNDFKLIYQQLAVGYFSFQVARESSVKYYAALTAALPDDEQAVEKAVRSVMKESLIIWLKIRSKQIQGLEQWN